MNSWNIFHVQNPPADYPVYAVAFQNNAVGNDIMQNYIASSPANYNEVPPSTLTLAGNTIVNGLCTADTFPVNGQCGTLQNQVYTGTTSPANSIQCTTGNVINEVYSGGTRSWTCE